ncbi:MAG: HAMP domain-containing histidine kinase [Oscillibacter sp.]|nr:HAMP domain-containing histidine kinase [Oscillibacter sp.]
MTARRWPIRTRILLTLIVLTSLILLSVAVTFNLFIRGYVQSRVSEQLDSILNGAIGGGIRKGPNGRGRKFDGGQDRLTGVRGSAVVLDGACSVRDTLNGDRETGEALSDYFAAGHTLSDAIRKKTVVLDSGTYIVSVARDPAQSDAYVVCYVDVTAIQAFTRTVNVVLFGVILSAWALSVLLSRWIARSFAEPIQDLSAFAGEIGRGDFQRRAFRFHDEEFSRLAEAMNRMAEELQKANRKQETFFQNVSHELRTPLTSIRGNAEGIVYGIMNPEVSGKIILAEADRLGGFVEDLLYLSRLGKAAPEEETQAVDLRDTLSLCVSEQRAEAERRGLSFAFDFDAAPVLFAIRERDARQLFGNLLSNAIRYAASEIRLCCHGDASGVIVRIADDGPGIAPDDLPRIFERFYKGAGGKHGIGLSIVKSVADIYRGTVTAENDNGAAFTVRFPGKVESPSP